MLKVTKAVFPVAGLGTRFLPATKASPKEMLPIVDKPLIQYAVEEAMAAGITEMIFITGRGKRAIEDHFDKAYGLEAELQAHGKNKLLKEVRGLLPDGVVCAYVRQAEELQTSIAYFRLSNQPTRKPVPGRLAPARVAKPAPGRPAPRKVATRGAVGAQQARAQGFALDLSQGGPDHDDSEFTEY